MHDGNNNGAFASKQREFDLFVCSSRDLIVRTLSDSVQLFYARADIMLLGISFQLRLKTTLRGHMGFERDRSKIALPSIPLPYSIR